MARRGPEQAAAAKAKPAMTRDEALKVLRLTDDATSDEIKAQYRKLAAKNHPDKAKNEADRQRREDRMKRLNVAFDILNRQQEAKKAA